MNYRITQRGQGMEKEYTASAGNGKPANICPRCGTGLKGGRCDYCYYNNYAPVRMSLLNELVPRK